MCHSQYLKMYQSKQKKFTSHRIISQQKSTIESKLPSKLPEGKLPPGMTAHKLHQLDTLWENEVTRKPYINLSKSQQYTRENELVGLVLTSVVSKECIKQFGLAYLTANKEKIAIHISLLLDNVKVKLEKII